MKITGVHEHAEYYPMLSEEQLEELAADIKENGQRDPITVTSDGILIDGRNRWEACKRLGIEPAIEIEDPKDVGSFVRSRNERRHQPTGSRAMSTALSMKADGLRTTDKAGNGRWAQGSAKESSEDPKNSKFRTNLAWAGLVLDMADALREKYPAEYPNIVLQVINGDTALDVAYKAANGLRKELEAERRAREQFEAGQVKNEADAKQFFETNEKAAAWLSEQPDNKFTTSLQAKTAYLEYDKALAWEEEKERRRKEQEKRDHEAARKRDSGRLRAFLDGWETAWAMRHDPYRDEVLANLEPQLRNRFITIERETTWPAKRI